MQKSESEAQSLQELEWAHKTLTRVAEVVEHNMHVGPNLHATNLYLVTSILWLRAGIEEMRRSTKV